MTKNWARFVQKATRKTLGKLLGRRKARNSREPQSGKAGVLGRKEKNSSQAKNDEQTNEYFSVEKWCGRGAAEETCSTTRTNMGKERSWVEKGEGGLAKEAEAKKRASLKTAGKYILFIQGIAYYPDTAI